MQFYAEELYGSIFSYDTQAHNKSDIRATVEVWRNEIAILRSLVNELMDK